MKKETLEEIKDKELDTVVKGFRVEIYKALLSCHIEGIRQVDIVFYRSASGTLPNFDIRRVLEESDVDSESLYRNVEHVVEFDVEEIKEMRRKTNNE